MCAICAVCLRNKCIRSKSSVQLPFILENDGKEASSRLNIAIQSVIWLYKVKAAILIPSTIYNRFYCNELN